MKHLILGLALALGLVLTAPAAPAAADSDSADSDWDWSWLFGGWRDRGGSGGYASVPELDPNVTGSAIVLLLGGVAYIASRRRDDD